MTLCQPKGPFDSLELTISRAIRDFVRGATMKIYLLLCLMLRLAIAKAEIGVRILLNRGIKTANSCSVAEQIAVQTALDTAIVQTGLRPSHRCNDVCRDYDNAQCYTVHPKCRGYRTRNPTTDLPVQLLDDETCHVQRSAVKRALRQEISMDLSSDCISLLRHTISMECVSID